ncbi:putative ribonuclease H-like domain-containing protein [Tanacetum coccineum]
MAYTSSNSSEVQFCSAQCLESVKKQLVVYQKNEDVYEEKIGILDAKDKTGLCYGDQMNENDFNNCEVVKNVIESVFDSRSSDGDDIQANDSFKKVDGYHAVPHPLTGNYIHLKADLSFASLDDSVYKCKVSEPSANESKVELNVTKTSTNSVEEPKTYRPSAPFIQEWDTDSDNDSIFRPVSDQPKHTPVKINFVKLVKYVKCVDSDKQTEKPRSFTQSPKVRVLVKRKQDHAAKKSFPRAAVSTSLTRPVNTATPKRSVNVSNSRRNTFHKSHSPIRSFYKSTAPNTRILNEKVNAVRVNGVNTTRQTAVSAIEGNGVTAGNPQQTLKNKGIFDSGCSRHMTRNKDFLTDSQEIDGGFVAFSGSTRGGKITGKGKIRTGKLDFEDVYFVQELKFNLFSVSQMCDKKNSVLFTKTECLVLSPNFKLLDESQVLLRVPRQSNMYSFDLKNVVPSGDLTCLFAKATLDESNLWHRRMGYVNFKTMNKLVKGNLVRGIPSKIFENDHTFVACQKGKQYKASCKAKLVFFLDTKDETSRILKRFITEIENQLNHKVKVIRCDNGTEFKNREMNEFYGLKGIKREFSVSKTSQQNGVAERKNRTLIEAARTMLADTLLPTTFWAEAVNTACYVLNRVLVTKPHNKTPYELIIGGPPSINFMRPFGCSVTILNTLDPLGKFDGKADEGFLVRYSVNSKAFRVFNTETRKVEENLHVNFLENKQNVVGQGPNWLFDIDSLTNSMNYQPVTARNQTNKNAGPQETNGDTGLKKNVDAGQTREKNVSTQQYIVLPLWSSISLSYKSLDEKVGDDTTDDAAVNAASASGTLSDAGPSFYIDVTNLPHDPHMHELEDTAEVQSTSIFGKAYDDDELDTYNYPYADKAVGKEADFNNMEPSTVVSLIPTIRVHSIHPKNKIIGYLKSAVQTRGMTKKSSGEHAMFSYIQKQHRTNHKDYQNCLFAYFLSQQEPKKLTQALNDASWVEAIQEELLQFKIQKVWTLVDLPCGKKAICTKIEEIRRYMLANLQVLWIQNFQKKVYKLENALYGLHQAPRAWYETLSTYLLDNGFYRGQIDKTLFIKRIKGDILLVQVYVDDIIFGSTKKSLCQEFEVMMHKRFQMSSMRELTFFLGLQVKQQADGIFISQDKYVADILKKFDFATVKIASTPLEPNKPLLKDEKAANMDVHLYRSMLGSLMYLTASRPDIIYLKGQPKLGLWYLRDSPFELEAFTDSDYAGASLDRKSTTGGCQFLGRRMISWQCKKQTIVANFTTEAEYVAAANCYAWSQGRLMVYKCSGLYTSAVWIEVKRLKILFGLVLRVKHGKKLVSAAKLALCCWAKVSTIGHKVSAARQT